MTLISIILTPISRYSPDVLNFKKKHNFIRVEICRYPWYSGERSKWEKYHEHVHCTPTGVQINLFLLLTAR